MPQVAERKNGWRRNLVWVGLAFVVLVLSLQVGWLMGDPQILPPDDFVEYWAAGRLVVTGHNPYDPAQLLPLQRQAGRDTTEAVMMWNPPWTLPLVIPLGLLPSRPAQILWLGLNLAVVLFCADWIWRFYGGPPRQRWLAWLIGMTFLPTFFVLQSGQIGPLILLGVVGFLHLERGRREWLAGVATLLLAIKPHLVYLFWIALLLWAIRQRRWRMLLGGVVAGAGATALPLIWDASVLGQYWQAMTHKPPEQWVSPTLGAMLRYGLGEDQFRLQFLPTMIGLLWFVPYWIKHRQTWDWSGQMPLLLLVSFLTTSYGAWPFDLVVLLVAVIQAAVWTWQAGRRWLTGLAVTLYLAVNGLALGMNVARLESVWFIWMTPALLLGYLLIQRLTDRKTWGVAVPPEPSVRGGLLAQG